MLNFSEILGVVSIDDHKESLRFSKPIESHFLHSVLSFQSDADESDCSHLDLSTFGEDTSFYRYNTINIIQLGGDLKICLTRSLSTFENPTEEYMFFAGSSTDRDIKELHDQLNTGYFKSYNFDASDEGLAKLIEVCSPQFMKIGFDENKIDSIKRTVALLIFSADQMAQKEKLKSSLFASSSSEVPLLSNHVSASFKLKLGNKLVDSSKDGYDALVGVVVGALKDKVKLDLLKFRVELDFRKIGSESLSLKMNVDPSKGKYTDYVFHDHFRILQEYSDRKTLENDLKLVASSFTAALVKKAESMICDSKIPA